MPDALLFPQYSSERLAPLILPSTKEGNLQTPSPASHQSVSTIPETQTIVLQQAGLEMLWTRQLPARNDPHSQRFHVVIYRQQRKKKWQSFSLSRKVTFLWCHPSIVPQVLCCLQQTAVLRKHLNKQVIPAAWPVPPSHWVCTWLYSSSSSLCLRALYRNMPTLLHASPGQTTVTTASPEHWIISDKSLYFSRSPSLTRRFPYGSQSLQRCCYRTDPALS